MSSVKGRRKMQTVKIMYAPTLEIARSVEAHVSVEAEYGAHVIEGSVLTLAHHQKEGPYSTAGEIGRAHV